MGCEIDHNRHNRIIQARTNGQEIEAISQSPKSRKSRKKAFDKAQRVKLHGWFKPQKPRKARSL